ncbi:hypothetical protein, variant [Aphanomyces astaci]|uniref:Uncharacterized protein n=2 Tax=Aphanomyces astaci TaxID=112090 RepID=W4HBJ9_APHAT|nr:hypothetical protein, variant [Aphanomyces astaci]ETV88493.1 hypothetical protein, variant [Aphanomyces astaci]|eukprot:XP_009820893.1 hypothetical protein, variant [Aphanomyces astaci]
MASVAPANFTPGQLTPARRISAESGRNAGSSNTSKRRLSSVKAIKTWRVTVLPGLIMFLCTLGLIFLSIFLLFLLISQGMFKRQVVTVNAQLADTYFWAPYGQSCILTSDGFTPNSCDADTASVIPDKPFAVVGTELAKQWAAELTQAGGTLYVTTCILGGTSNVGWTDLQFIAGYDYFPECLPTEPQDVAGMAMLETTIRDTHVDGLYFLTLYADLDPSMTVYSYVNSDGTTQNLIDNIKRTLISVDGQVETDKLGRDYIITSRPLGDRYLVTGFCDTVVEELSELKDGLGLTGWSQGKHSKLPVVPAWSCGHVVENADEVIVLQAMSSFLSLWFFAGDMFITIEGLGGLLSGAPVLKYTVLSGLERRKWLLVSIVVNSMPGLLYMDVSRIYYYSTNGFKVYVLSSIMVANFFTFGFFIALSLFDTLVGLLRSFSSCVGYSAPIFTAVCIVWMTQVWCHDAFFLDVYNKFYSAPAFLGFYVNNATWPSGSYVAEGTPPIVTYLVKTIVTTVGGSFGIAIAISSIYRRIIHKQWLVSTVWCRSNSVLSALHLPNCITALPLESSNGIKMGNKMYCKPSTIAIMGYTTVVERQKWGKDKRHANQLPNQLISIYALVPAMVVPSWVSSLGTVDHNQFTPTPATRLAQAKPVVHTRGSCVV